MRKSLVCLTIALFAACVCGQAEGSSIVVANSESVTFTGVDSVGPYGDAGNTILNHTFTGGFMANAIVVSGQLTEVLTGTYASEAEIDIVCPNGAGYLAPSSVTSYTGTLVVDPTTFTIPTPFDPAGEATFEFYEGYDDGAGADQTWDTITWEFQEMSVVNGNYNMGVLPGDGSIVSAAGSHVAGGLDFFEIELSAALNPASGYLNVQTYDPLTGDNMDTEMALFDSAGILVALDDDGQASGFGGLYSMLSFGAADPLAPGGSDANAGEDGATLAAGAYTVVVGGYDTNFEDLTIGSSHISEVVGGSSEGDYGIDFAFSIPEPTMVLPLCLAGLALIRRRK